MLTTILVEQRSLAGSKTATTFVPDTDTPISAACLPSKHLWLRQLLFSPDNRTYRISGGINFRHRWHRKHFNSGPTTISVAKPSQFPSLASIFASSSNETSYGLSALPVIGRSIVPSTVPSSVPSIHPKPQHFPSIVPSNTAVLCAIDYPVEHSQQRTVLGTSFCPTYRSFGCSIMLQA